MKEEQQNKGCIRVGVFKIVKMKEDKKIFVDKFTDRTYTMSMYEDGKYTMDIATVNEYQNENPYITFNTSATLTDIKDIVIAITKQQEDVNCFGVLLTELNAEELSDDKDDK